MMAVIFLPTFCGVIAAEIRLPEAINRRHLCPFQYFGIDDDTDFAVTWKITLLSSPISIPTISSQKIVQSPEIVTDITKIKAGIL